MILSRGRAFSREEPEESAKLFIIFCEGGKREYHYFRYFAELDSRLNIEIIYPAYDDNNSPEGLVHKANDILFPTERKPKYDIKPDDEVWFIVDTDHWGDKLDVLYNAAKEHSNWFVAQSNPCFEVWLYFHFSYEVPNFEGMNTSESWKNFLGGYKAGGFSSLKHPILIKDAIANAKHTLNLDEEGRPEFIGTNVHILAERILKLVERKIDSARNKMKI